MTFIIHRMPLVKIPLLLTPHAWTHKSCSHHQYALCCQSHNSAFAKFISDGIQDPLTRLLDLFALFNLEGSQDMPPLAE